MVRVLGIGGGAGTGKTTLASFLEERGVDVLKLDELSAKLAKKGGPIWKEVVRTWERVFLDGRGNLNRKKLGKVAFRDPQVLFMLNRLAHPLLFWETRKWLNRMQEKPLVAIEGAILFEGNFLPLLDWTVCMEASVPTRTRRLMEKGWTEKDARNLVKAQRFCCCLERRANFTIPNERSLEELRERAELLWRYLWGGPEIERQGTRFLHCEGGR